MRIAVDSSAQRIEPLLFELSAKRIERLGTFGHLRGAVDDRSPLRFHHRKNASAPVKIRPVHQKMAMSSQRELRRRRVFQPIPDDAPDRALTVPALSSKLSDAVALHDPAPKPDLFTQLLVGWIVPDKRAAALAATKPLPLFGTLPMLPDPPVSTVQTVPFLPSHHPRLLKGLNVSTHKSPFTISFFPKRATDFGHYSQDDGGGAAMIEAVQT